MLKSLTIDNYAIISNLHIDWAEGLNIVTGQTGAGKSIILGAMSLLSGQKADVSQLLDKQRPLVVEAVFGIEGYGLSFFFSDNDLDYADEITIRRQISPNGKSRCFIDDIPVSQQVMKELSDRLIDIHSQHQSLLLARERFQTDILDSIAGTRQLRTEVKECFGSYEALRRETDALRSEVDNTEREKDFISFQIEELTSLDVHPGQYASLSDRLSVMEHSEDIARALSATYGLLEGDDNSVCLSLQQLGRGLASVSGYMESLSELSKRLASCSIELKDIASEVGNILSGLSFDPAEKQRIENRMDQLNDMMAKYGVGSEEELLKALSGLKERLESLEAKRDRLSRKEEELADVNRKLLSLCRELSEKRSENCSSVESYVINTLSSIGIDKARFSVEMSDKTPSADGADNIEFLFSANALSPMQPIAKAASGGEISRLMLVLKSLAATRMKLPTVVFDEVDTGVSGAVADSMGNMICSMAQGMQVINITHLPQVAAKGSQHYEVFKEESTTMITRLTGQQRVEKIASMLSGADITEAARQQARQLLGTPAE